MSDILIEKIFLPKSAIDSDKSWVLVEESFFFVDELMHRGLYQLNEFHSDYVMLYHLAQYDGEVKNGGLEQYIANRGWHEDVADQIITALNKIGAEKHAELFHRVRKYVGADENTRNEMARRGGFDDIGGCGPIDPQGANLDNEYCALNRTENITDKASAYLRHHEALVVVNNDEWQKCISDITSANPYLEERLDKKKKQEEERKAIYQRKISACGSLSKKLGQSIDASRGIVKEITYKGQPYKAVIHKTDKGHEVAYLELDGKAVLISYPGGEFLAAEDLHEI